MKQVLKLIIIVLICIPVFAYSQTNNNYITVGYSSICCGPPSEKPVTDFVKNFEEQNKLKPFEIFVEGGLGKEGEYAFYIGTDNLDVKLLESFWNGIKVVVSNQNKQRSEHHDGYVNLDDKLATNSTMKSKKLQLITL
ncbi:MAG: hypothetical protein CFE23_14465 [Flavobacterium sp. BFFFF1]|uniref:hypothetical protein n=1 Tax=Flavobacterium sp. BFFFF1 TaxID=2015557 RepID=UPI000BCD1F4E|nr:hypothetical protein [Flavobacterium sp. BFFFF1]OYU79369.1 MAG: hypothetical protein CFE23_14465 [Flavobacterium sp. BFFFF1]